MASRIAREPLLQLLVLGGVIFTLSHWVGSNAAEIVVTRHEIAELAGQFEAQYGSRPSERQLERLVEQFINSEVLYRKAVAMKLDRSDEIIRRRLIQKYDFLRRDLDIPPEPTEKQLLQHYRDHAAAYQDPPRATFTHVYVSSDAYGDDVARTEIRALSALLSASNTNRVPHQGDPFPGPQQLVALSKEEAIRVFGDHELVQAMFTCETGRWSAPVRSAFGWHSIYVTDRHAARQFPFHSVKERVKQDYLQRERERRDAESMAVLRKDFRIIRE